MNLTFSSFLFYISTYKIVVFLMYGLGLPKLSGGKPASGGKPPVVGPVVGVVPVVGPAGGSPAIGAVA